MVYDNFALYTIPYNHHIMYLNHAVKDRYCCLTGKPITGLSFGAKLSLSSTLSGNPIQNIYAIPPSISGYTARIHRHIIFISN